MEVHHHPQVEKKKIKEYFLEFLMIFLAVTMGFFAENVRENISNNERANSLAEQLIKGLQADTANLNNVIAYENVQQERIDTLFIDLQTPVIHADTKQIQQLVFHLFSLKLFVPNIGAISAIEKDLNLKRISKSQLPEKIAAYGHGESITKSNEEIVDKMIGDIISPFVKRISLHPMRTVCSQQTT
ncbi:MAG TPA: hypothetical protein VK787_03785 [Puia sp.]|jgi:hypothetical protein|nr:hypothetical protein [Puia sp.]